MRHVKVDLTTATHVAESSKRSPEGFDWEPGFYRGAGRQSC